jgi:hypothetical protein
MWLTRVLGTMTVERSGRLLPHPPRRHHKRHVRFAVTDVGQPEVPSRSTCISPAFPTLLASW